ncbi:DUF4973 domain-containing protein [Bacteroides thetaiotaomicron]|nr:DUF4973 domain-containing protein [Bacteroides thetaiotaomicron]
MNESYKANEATTYQVPLIVSGTTLNDKKLYSTYWFGPQIL